MKVWYSLIPDARLQSCEPSDRWLFVAAIATAAQGRKPDTSPITARGISNYAGIGHGSAAKGFARLRTVGVLSYSDFDGPIAIDADIFKDATEIHGPYEAIKEEGRRKKEEGKDQRQEQGLPAAPAPELISSSEGAGTPATIPKPTSLAKRNGKADTAGANALIAKFRDWYERQYRRTHAQAAAKEVFQVAALLRRVQRDVEATPSLQGKTAEAVVRAAVNCAVENRWDVFPLNRGEPLTLGVLIGNWPKLFDRLLRAGQEQGAIPPERDPDLDREQA